MVVGGVWGGAVAEERSSRRMDWKGICARRQVTAGGKEHDPWSEEESAGEEVAEEQAEGAGGGRVGFVDDSVKAGDVCLNPSVRNRPPPSSHPCQPPNPSSSRIFCVGRKQTDFENPRFLPPKLPLLPKPPRPNSSPAHTHSVPRIHLSTLRYPRTRRGGRGETTARRYGGE